MENKWQERLSDVGGRYFLNVQNESFDQNSVAFSTSVSMSQSARTKHNAAMLHDIDVKYQSVAKLGGEGMKAVNEDEEKNWMLEKIVCSQSQALISSAGKRRRNSRYLMKKAPCKAISRVWHFSQPNRIDGFVFNQVEWRSSFVFLFISRSSIFTTHLIVETVTLRQQLGLQTLTSVSRSLRDVITQGIQKSPSTTSFAQDNIVVRGFGKSTHRSNRIVSCFRFGLWDNI